MEHDTPAKHLREWARLARDNAENEITSALFDASGGATSSVESFSSWLLVACAAVASFMLANAEDILPVVSRTGFLVCGACLLLSCGCGLLAKIFGLRCKVMTQLMAALRSQTAAVLSEYEKEEAEIKKAADTHGISIDTDVRIERVIEGFAAKLPWWAKPATMVSEGKASVADPHAAYAPIMTNLTAQSLWTGLQAVCFMAFLTAGFGFAAANF
jgi:hypothetical protein